MKRHMTVRLLPKKIQKAYAAALALLIVVPVLVLSQSSLYAAELLQRSITVSDSTPSATANHVFRFNVASSASLGSIVFEYCGNSPLFDQPCVAPTGLDASSVSLAAQSGETGFTLHPSSNTSRIVLTRVAAPATPQPVQYDFSDITNPSTPKASVFVRISTYGSSDGSGAIIDKGSVAFSTEGDIGTTLFVPPYLTFCAGATVAPDCSSVSGFGVDLGILSPELPSTGSTQFAAATNDPTGYNVAITGITMTSGNNVIPALNPAGGSIPGVSQFGLNLRANTAPVIGQNSSGTGSGTAMASYNIPNQFKFSSGDVIASSPLPTNFNTFTVSYLVNVSENQAPGVYASTLTYIATAAF